MQIQFQILLIVLLFVAGCSSDTQSVVSGSSLESKLAKSATWPQELVGVLDIVEAGDPDESGYTSWAVGNLITEEDPEGILVEIGDGVFAAGKVEIDNDKSVRVWVDAPHSQYGGKMFPIAKIRYE